MPPSPEEIIDAINSRHAEAKRARRRKILLRTADLLRLAMVAAGFVYLTRNVSMPAAISAGAMLFAFLAHDRQKRWALEEELKKRTDKEAKPAPRATIIQ